MLTLTSTSTPVAEGMSGTACLHAVLTPTPVADRGHAWHCMSACGVDPHNYSTSTPVAEGMSGTACLHAVPTLTPVAEGMSGTACLHAVPTLTPVAEGMPGIACPRLSEVTQLEGSWITLQ